MIRVSVEVVPHGDEARAEQVARIDIVNTGDHPYAPTMGNYVAQIAVRRPDGNPQINRRHIEDFDRLRWNVLGLLRATLEALDEDMLFAGENVTPDMIASPVKEVGR